ncbi:hypothetical protein CMO92_04440 [Candidatus Woesearchaeota archaeon]|nr:hypothetical protein [Candidatus Woesearchaeota archaeon]
MENTSLGGLSHNFFIKMRLGGFELVSYPPFLPRLFEKVAFEPPTYSLGGCCPIYPNQNLSGGLSDIVTHVAHFSRGFFEKGSQTRLQARRSENPLIFKWFTAF